ncbi:glutamyl-tRNA reductase [Varunaivibrio sulfuroxidans]|uniref:Glutamyl-tRNA reductase n=1 Tax=Varunaivibrio sulfuroxidans TaxID=1773489 RepID=A0A4V2UPA5_9PROT|nr:glutamyl-tRNA reductase [Varunaivibrio sulfuroxidans]TCS65101.1 glutamyl-tRNA reductase [Varunaivibrio sulfuroxidans]WES29612.1 glutamyl-tRNA reductase [Varunaivibrio sulfuroxidans]
MADTAVQPGQTLVVGANHRSSALVVRDRLFVEDAVAPFILGQLRAQGIDCAMVLSTCDRVEVAAMHADARGGERKIREILAAYAMMPIEDLEGQVYTLTGEAAVRHIFTVAASLDSAMVGEPQVLGQVKAAHRLASGEGMVAPAFERLLQAAYGAAKRVRSETAIGARPVSMASSAVELVRDLHGDPARLSGVMIGVGDMGELIARDMLAAGLNRMSVVHTRIARAEFLAKELGCHVDSIDDLEALLASADVVISALGERHHVIGTELVRAAIAKRRNKPIFIIDAGVPGDVDPAVNAIDEAFLYDLADLERVALRGRASREHEAAGAQVIVDEELAAFLHDRAERAAVPILARLRAHVEEMRLKALADAQGDGEKATRLLVNRLMHHPSEMMRALAAHDPEHWRRMADTICAVFDLPAGAEDGGVDADPAGDDDGDRQ